jgi:hypothetical protein
MMNLKKGGNQMEMFSTAEEIVEAVCNEDDIAKRKAAVKTLVGFAIHKKDYMASSVGAEGLAGKVVVSLLFMATQNVGELEGGE